MEMTRVERKKIQVNNFMKYQDDKEVIKDEMDNNQGTDIMEAMMKERRDWIQEMKKTTVGKVPADIKGFYEKDKV